MAPTFPNLRLLCTLCLCGLAATLLPPENIATWRSGLHDTLAPGQTLARNCWQHATETLATATSRFETDRQTDTLREQLAASERKNRRLELEAAALREQIQIHAAHDTGYFSIDRRASLFQTELLEARVLGEDTAALWRSRMTIGAGHSTGLVESSLVLNDEKPLLDQGEDASLHSGDAIYAGRTVLGKVAEVGRWSSTFRHVTDPGFSGRAQLARRTARGLVFLSEGTLTGDGSDFCRLQHISEPVNVGDEVFTGGTDGVLPFPMYYGTVVSAELEPAAREWTVRVKPAAPDDLPALVQILRVKPNPARMLAD